MLRSTNREVVMAAIEGLAEARQLTSDRLEAFRAGFHSEVGSEHWLSVMIVGASGSGVAARFVPELIGAADPRSPDSKRALQGLFLVMTGAAAPADRRFSAAEAYLALESNPDRWGALNSLSRQGTNAACLLPVVIPMLNDTTPNVRAKAAEVLGQIGPAARPALPQLRALQNDE
ncbi:MAG TPA: HEAT repeat domain-containing protein [Candidatus Limnocylindria bacterium]|jgi:hypothetical protein|nr:HEAT repeat domain-containing protein [Candidatus Limnocylindria bacterium]